MPPAMSSAPQPSSATTPKSLPPSGRPPSPPRPPTVWPSDGGSGDTESLWFLRWTAAAPVASVERGRGDRGDCVTLVAATRRDRDDWIQRKMDAPPYPHTLTRERAPISYLLSPISYLPSPISLSPISYLLSPISYLLSPISLSPYLLISSLLDLISSSISFYLLSLVSFRRSLVSYLLISSIDPTLSSEAERSIIPATTSRIFESTAGLSLACRSLTCVSVEMAACVTSEDPFHSFTTTSDGHKHAWRGEAERGGESRVSFRPRTVKPRDRETEVSSPPLASHRAECASPRIAMRGARPDGPPLSRQTRVRSLSCRANRTLGGAARRRRAGGGEGRGEVRAGGAAARTETARGTRAMAM